MNNGAPKQGPNTMSYSGPSAVNPLTTESTYIPSSESTHSGRSYSPDHPGERVADSSAVAIQYVNHSNMPTSPPGYAYAEHGRSGLQGVTDVDVDEKPHLVYESMAEFQHQARQRMQMNMKTNMESGDKYASVPNKANRSFGSRAMCCMIRLIWNLFLLILVLGAFSLSVYNFVSNTTVKTETTAPTIEPGQLTGAGGGDDVSARIEQLNATVMELEAMLNELSATHQQRYLEVNNTILAAIESVQSVSPTNELDLTFGCVDNVAECLINHEHAGTPPSSATCETSSLPVSVDGMSNVNIYCNVDNTVGEANPLVATLNINNGAITCICNIVATAIPTGDPSCKLHVRRCPNTIRLNTTMQ